MSVAESLGDLAVSVEELRHAPRPDWVSNTRERFHAWYDFGRPLFERTLVVLCELGDETPTDAELEPVRLAAKDNLVFRELFEHLVEAFDAMGWTIGYFYGGVDWRLLCVWRSAAATFEAFGIEFDLDEADGHLVRFSDELFEPVEIPEGMPPSHWWWFAPRSGE